MTIENIIAGKAIGHLIDKSLKYISSVLSNTTDKDSVLEKELELALQNQLSKTLTFSNCLEALRFDDRRHVTESTIDLSISNSTRQSFQSLDNSTHVTEYDLLIDSRSQLILGDPGSGKTTTLKRLVSESFRLMFEEDENAFPFSFPMFYKLAEISIGESLFSYLAKNIGVPYETISKEVPYETIETIKIHDPKNKYADVDGFIYKENVVTKNKIIYEYKVGNLSLDIVLANIINKQNTVIFLDGLDELHYQIRNNVFEEIKKLLLILDDSKLIITSRYFEGVDSFKNISKNEILPLSDEESLRIVKQWIEDTNVFWDSLSGKPYKELATRPLFLFYLVMLYKANNGILPDQGVDIYRQVVLLVLREWDEQKEHKSYRYSQIKNFDTYKKEEFIGHIAFNLTYELGIKKIFSHADLTRTYGNIYKKYSQLKSSDAKSVIKDIETDNALIITSYVNEYEFSHLSLQEYLCAKHILSVPFSRKIYDYLTTNPEPLALAVILSSEPSNWFAMLVLNNINEPQYNRQLTPSIIYVFINRLITEGAVFDEVNLEFGMAILYLIFAGTPNTMAGNILYKFLDNTIVRSSARLAISKFKISNKKREEIDIVKNIEIHSDFFLSFPNEGTVPIYLWKLID